jgi:glycosyltransferase involved in cell wall biosynthesis
VLLPSVSIVIPALNEARNIPHVLDRIPNNIHQVILVDRGSTDNTVQVARNARPDVFVVKQTRRGKGNALACGFEAATGDIIVMLDADGSADPCEMPRFVDALVAGADFAKGTRFALGGGSSDITRLRKFGNDGLTAVFNLCYGRRYSDLCYGYNVFWRYCVPVLGLDATAPAAPDGGKLWGDGFEVETLIHVRIAKAGLKVAEVPSYEYPRLHGVSNLNAARDGLRVVRTMLAERRGARSASTPVRTQPSPTVAPRGRREPSPAVAPLIRQERVATEEGSVLLSPGGPAPTTPVGTRRRPRRSASSRALLEKAHHVHRQPGA